MVRYGNRCGRHALPRESGIVIYPTFTISPQAPSELNLRTRSQSVMPPRGLMSSFAFAALAATASLLVAPQAQAQGLFEFLWGGGQEWGGGKQTVSFDAKYTPGQIIVSFGD